MDQNIGGTIESMTENTVTVEEWHSLDEDVQYIITESGKRVDGIRHGFCHPHPATVRNGYGNRST